jgi:hypothetical protein
MITENHNNLPVPSITPLFNLLALRNKLNPKSVLMVCVFHFQSNLILPYQLHWVTYFYEMWSEEFIYRAFNWSIKNTFDEPWRGTPPPFIFSSKVEERLMMTFVMENCLLDLFVVLKSKLCSERHGIYWSGLVWNKWHFWNYAILPIYM